ncbi:MAG: phosphomevalonate kinase [Watsoniomyces obsoletus]|nr:MAG: phosphomevalonate kinase [Watsoniomyces obsoletus]
MAPLTSAKYPKEYYEESAKEDILATWKAFFEKHPRLGQDLTMEVYDVCRQDIIQLDPDLLSTPARPVSDAGDPSSSGPMFSPRPSPTRPQSSVRDNAPKARLKVRQNVLPPRVWSGAQTNDDRQRFASKTPLKGHGRKKSREEGDVGPSTSPDVPQLRPKAPGKQLMAKQIIDTDVDNDDLDQEETEKEVEEEGEIEEEEELQEEEDVEVTLWKIKADVARVEEEIARRNAKTKSGAAIAKRSSRQPE